MSRLDPQGHRLTALPPVYEFTNHSDFVYGCGAVFLMDWEGKPHWFASDGYSAMLTPALVDLDGMDLLFPVTVGQRCYQPQHIKALFRHVKHSNVIYDPAAGTLTSPDGIMIVPPYVRDADPGEEPEPVLPPDARRVFEGEEEAQSTFEFGWAFVASVRAAFKANSKDAVLTMTCLEGERVLLDVHEPYQGRVLIALSRTERPHDAPAPTPQEEVPAATPAVLPDHDDDLAVERYLDEGCPNCTDAQDPAYLAVQRLLSACGPRELATLLESVGYDPTDWDDHRQTVEQDAQEWRNLLLGHWRELHGSEALRNAVRELAA